VDRRHLNRRAFVAATVSGGFALAGMMTSLDYTT
jgi:hypothetical protein